MNEEQLTSIFQQDIPFWQATFWGILGSVTGIAGLIISWFSFKYNTPNIEIDRMYLVIPDWVAKDWRKKTVAELKSSFLDYELEMVVRNKRGGSGSIDKPNLVIGIPNKLMRFFTKEQFIKVAPITEHQEREKDKDYSGGGELWHEWTVRHGRAFNLGGGEKADERLEYHIYKAEHIFEIVQNFDKLRYYAEYSNNNGKLHRVKITKLYNESERHKY